MTMRGSARRSTSPRAHLPSRPRFAAALALLATLVLVPALSPRSAPAHASSARLVSASSDLLLMLDADGRGYLAQHTLSSEGALIVLALPGSVEADHVSFAGPERALFAAAHRNRPGRLSLWSGSAFVRYRHRHPDALVTARDGHVSLAVASVPARLTIEEGELASSSITWVLPEGFEFVSLGDVAPARGRWSRTARSARFEQRGRVPVELRLSYRRTAIGPDSIACLESGLEEGDACAPDGDRDGVPDRRDVCPAEASRPPDADGFGCASGTDSGGSGHGSGGAGETVLALEGVTFRDGQSYLDADARRALDRLARAIAHVGLARVHEIVVHTDSTGSARRNRELSTERARAVRHYLMLRGVAPNRLRARGAGESAPLDDEADGRSNRRVELRVPGPITTSPPAVPAAQ